MGYLPPPPPQDEWIDVTCLSHETPMYIRKHGRFTTRPERFIPARVDGTVVRDAKVGTALLLALFVSIGAAIAQWAGLL